MYSNILENDINYIYSNLNNKKFFHNSEILITGCCGFLGFYFIEFFIRYLKTLKIKKIYFIDINNQKLTKYRKKYQSKNIHFLKFDIINDDLKKIKAKFNIIIHAASIASPSFYRKKPFLTAYSNVEGAKKLLNYSVKNKVKKFLFFSSSEIYGEPDKKNIPTKETYNGNVSTIGPRACYDESKRYVETLCYIFAKSHKLPITIVRPFNNYGPGMTKEDKRLPADLAKNILDKKNIVIYSNGKPTRSFCYVSDAILGYLKAIVYNKSKFEIFNIGNDTKEVDVFELAKIYKIKSEKLLNFSPKIIFKKNKDSDYLKNNPNRRMPNIDKARKLLLFKPTIGTATGVEKYLKFLLYDKH